MKQVKSKDYYIIKVRCYASPYYLKLFHSKDEDKSTLGRMKQMDAGQADYKFFWGFIKQLTGKSEKEFQELYWFDARDCACEEIKETYGVLVTHNESCNRYYLPKNETNHEVFQWMQKNAPNTFKVLKKTYVTFLDSTPTTWKREWALEKSKDIREQLKFNRLETEV